MELTEWSNEFDILYNNITSNQAPGLDEYEKSVLLTKAQEDVIKHYFTIRGNKVQEGFDTSERRQMDFSNLIQEIDNIQSENNTVTITDHIEPDEIFLILNEYVKVNNRTLVVVPIHYREYERLLSKPFPYPNKSQAWRLDLGLGTFRIIAGPSDVVSDYSIRYLKRPEPIILEDLEDGLVINGRSEANNCKLNPSIHRDIIQRAVEIAKATYVGDLNTQIAIGSNSQTEVGIIPSNPYQR